MVTGRYNTAQHNFVLTFRITKLPSRTESTDAILRWLRVIGPLVIFN
nr:MAG TPA: hypothetical protein [Caudoviricetes sp.]